MNGLHLRVGGTEAKGEKPTRKEEVALLKVSKWSARFAENAIPATILD